MGGRARRCWLRGAQAAPASACASPTLTHAPAHARPSSAAWGGVDDFFRRSNSLYEDLENAVSMSYNQDLENAWHCLTRNVPKIS